MNTPFNKDGTTIEFQSDRWVGNATEGTIVAQFHIRYRRFLDPDGELSLHPPSLATDTETLRALYIRLAEGIVAAAEAVPALNAWFESSAQSLRLLKRVDLGIAVDTPEGLMVLILHDVGAAILKNYGPDSMQ